jgi:flagellar basal-body rod modification protein FlgD
MSTVQQTTASTATAAASGAVTKNAVQETEERFLKLLVTQMRNQDPLNPMDNAQVTSQMAQLSTVSGINKLNDSLSGLSSLYQSSQTLQASGMIGRYVLAEGSELELKQGVSVGGIELADPADKVTVTIKDSAGTVLDTMDLGSQKAGVVNFGWDGITKDGVAAADGKYQFSVKAVQGDKNVTAKPLALSTVGSVTLGAQGPIMNTGLGALSISQIKQIL